MPLSLKWENFWDFLKHVLCYDGIKSRTINHVVVENKPNQLSLVFLFLARLTPDAANTINHNTHYSFFLWTNRMWRWQDDSCFDKLKISRCKCRFASRTLFSRVWPAYVSHNRLCFCGFRLIVARKFYFYGFNLEGTPLGLESQRSMKQKREI